MRPYLRVLYEALGGLDEPTEHQEILFAVLDDLETAYDRIRDQERLLGQERERSAQLLVKLRSRCGHPATESCDYCL